MKNSSVFYLWRNTKACQGFASGVSLHSHTNQSRETLKFLAMLGARYRLMRRMMQRLERRSEANHGMRVDYARSYWTPPMPPKLAFDLESEQIEKLGLAPLVSLSDHDNINAPLLLRSVIGERQSPVSVEWTVPYGAQAFHLGIHNLPASTASEWMQILAAFTDCPTSAQLKAILATLHAMPEVLVVFNHPMWDLYRVGEPTHHRMVNDFLRENSAWIHAIELNALRNWKENRDAARLAESWKMVLISGGDRHGVEPNAAINLTNADSFDEFVGEIREDRRSVVLFMPQYAQPWKHRILRSAVDAVRHYPHFPAGSQRWDDRVYHPDAKGVPRPLSALWPDGRAPRPMRWGIGAVQLMGNGLFSHSLRIAWSEAQEARPALEESDIQIQAAASGMQ
ncbi:MAG TPA: hypothetical protein VGS02_19320 [Acidobacteriaceae bacterium]|nr:hypothetical protein [Acidobacteriaceae bacterium]